MSQPDRAHLPLRVSRPQARPRPPATYARALAAGATPVTEVTACFFGDRVGRVRDPLATSGGSRPTWKTSIPRELARRPQDSAAARAPLR